MNNSKAGFAKIAIGIVLLLIAVMVVVYFTSDVGRTRMQGAYNQYAHWTPENIAKDPENYLNFCEEEANKALISLKASEIAVAQNRASLDATGKAAANKVILGEKALVELKDAYSNAVTASSWPITFQGERRDQDWTKRQIVSFHRQVEGQKNLKTKVEAGINTLDAQVTKIQEARSKTEEQLTEIRTGRELLKVQKVTDDLAKRFTAIGAVLQTSVALASQSTGSGTITLDNLAAKQATAVDDDEFNAIMGK